ncbi:hypothetical protein [Nonomuraea aridisoli]|uniref:hypothetical protein n=1 Tax=Nonomuraea aridisoli TaxID=2070368 RepID=UPI0015E88E18|nr:hypothetical protein [Nonomuraea aridisoli]
MTGESGETTAGTPTLTPVYRQILAVVEQAPERSGADASAPSRSGSEISTVVATRGNR